jgi:adenosine kinase
MATFTIPGCLVGMGNPLLDISAEVGQDVLDKYGVEMDSAILAEEKHLPVYDELVKDYAVQYIAGGATQNSIRVAQWMIGVPGASSFFGCVGKDKFGDELAAAAKADGVNAQYMVDDTTPTGTCAVLIKDNERSLIANLGAANNMKAAHLETAPVKALIEAGKYYYCAGFNLTVGTDHLDVICKHACDEGKVFMMNLSAPFLIQFFGTQMFSIMPYCDYVFGNESEAATLGETKGWGKDISEIALKLAACPKASGTRPRVVVFTQGADSTVVACNGTVSTYKVEELPKELLVDTNGAGDAFVGGFISQLVRGAAVEECVKAGHWAARVIIQRSGCSFPKECSYSGVSPA